MARTAVTSGIPRLANGGIFIKNANFENGTGTVTASGWVGSQDYGWYATFYNTPTGSVSYDNTVYHLGAKSLKIVVSESGAGKIIQVRPFTGTAPTRPFLFMPVLKPSTSYFFSVWVKTDNITNNGGKGFATYLQEYNSAGTGVASSVVSGWTRGTTDWTLYTKTVTTNAATMFATMDFQLELETGTAWADDLIIRQTVASRSAASARSAAAARSAA